MEESEGIDLDSFIDLMMEDNNLENESKNVFSIADNPKAANASNGDIDFLSPAPTVMKLDAPSTLNNTGSSLIHTGDTSSDEESTLTEIGQEIKKKIALKSNYEERKKINKETWTSKRKSGEVSKEEPNSLDKLTGVKVVKPVVAFDVMEKRLQGRKLIKMSFMKGYVKNGNIDGDWVTVGVLVRKMPPKTSKTGKLFSIWQLTDLYSTEKIVSFFLFGAVHSEHWKTAVGTVIGLLNPQFMDSNEKGDYASIKIDHPGKLMLIGTSKDFGFCKSKRKDGTQCTNPINLSLCQYCAYHVKNEYKKFSQRSELQSSWTGRGLDLRDKVLKGQNFFYAGQSFAPLGKPKAKSPAISSKDKLTISNLTLKRKAATVFNEEKSKSVKKIVEMYGDEVTKAAEKNSEFINNQLMIPSAGSRNFLQYMVKNKAPEDKRPCYVNPKDLLKQHALQMKSLMTPRPTKKDDITILRNLVPTLGKGLSPGQNVTLDIKPPNSNPVGHYAKIRAIQKIKQNGPIQKKNPNAVKSNPELMKVKAVLDSSLEKNSDNDKTGNEVTLSRGRLGCIDLNSEKIQNILNRKSKHAYEVEMAEMEKEAAYFDRLEKKEMMEEKMSSTKEIVCDVVSCKQCRYTAHHAADRCKNENHPLKCHKAIKRFFACKDCKNRTECFNRFPHRACSNCGGSRFERTGMLKVRTGPKLDSEILNISSDEAYFLNSL